MSDHQQDFSERLIDLCSDYASGDLASHDLNELAGLDPDSTARDLFESIAAQIDCAYAQHDPLAIPDGLEDRLFSVISSDTQIDQSPTPLPTLKLADAPVPVSIAAGDISRVSQPIPWFPWLVAAASIAVTGFVLLRPSPALPARSPAEQRDQLIAQTDPDSLLRYNWTATDDPAVVSEVSGELIWDDATDQGYMTISGLQINNPSEFQYQLWIFDATRPLNELPQFAGAFDGLLTQRPIDGGVFDITSTGEVVIPIDAKLLVKQGIAFAVTVERPGGVVVSDRARVPLLALPG